MVLTSPTVRISSHSIAVVALIPSPGSVIPAVPCSCSNAVSVRTARTAPNDCAMTYAGTRFHGKSPRHANATVTTGFKCAPDTDPMKRMIAAIMSPGAVARAAALIVWPPKRAFTSSAPTATKTSRYVPSNSANRRRHSLLSSRNCCWYSGCGRSSTTVHDRRFPEAEQQGIITRGPRALLARWRTGVRSVHEQLRTRDHRCRHV